MIMKTRALTATTPYEVAVALLFDDIFKQAITSRLIEHRGTGRDNTEVNLGFNSQFVLIIGVKTSPMDPTPAGGPVIGVRNAGGLSYIIGTGYSTISIKDFKGTSIVLGACPACNASGQNYRIYAVG